MHAIICQHVHACACMSSTPFCRLTNFYKKAFFVEPFCIGMLKSKGKVAKRKFWCQNNSQEACFHLDLPFLLEWPKSAFLKTYLVAESLKKASPLQQVMGAGGRGWWLVGGRGWWLVGGRGWWLVGGRGWWLVGGRGCLYCNWWMGLLGPCGCGWKLLGELVGELFSKNILEFVRKYFGKLFWKTILEKYSGEIV